MVMNNAQPEICSWLVFGACKNGPIVYLGYEDNDAARRPTYQLHISDYDDAHFCSAVIRVDFRTFCRLTESALAMTHLPVRPGHRS